MNVTHWLLADCYTTRHIRVDVKQWKYDVLGTLCWSHDNLVDVVIFFLLLLRLIFKIYSKSIYTTRTCRTVPFKLSIELLQDELLYFESQCNFGSHAATINAQSSYWRKVCRNSSIDEKFAQRFRTHWKCFSLMSTFNLWKPLCVFTFICHLLVVWFIYFEIHINFQRRGEKESQLTLKSTKSMIGFLMWLLVWH